MPPTWLSNTVRRKRYRFRQRQAGRVVWTRSARLLGTRGRMQRSKRLGAKGLNSCLRHSTATESGIRVAASDQQRWAASKTGQKDRSVGEERENARKLRDEKLRGRVEQVVLQNCTSRCTISIQAERKAVEHERERKAIKDQKNNARTQKT
jgi:hypothetical protein